MITDAEKRKAYLVAKEKTFIANMFKCVDVFTFKGKRYEQKIYRPTFEVYLRKETEK